MDSIHELLQLINQRYILRLLFEVQTTRRRVLVRNCAGLEQQTAVVRARILQLESLTPTASRAEPELLCKQINELACIQAANNQKATVFRRAGQLQRHQNEERQVRVKQLQLTLHVETCRLQILRVQLQEVSSAELRNPVDAARDRLHELRLRYESLRGCTLVLEQHKSALETACLQMLSAIGSKRRRRANFHKRQAGVKLARLCSKEDR